MSLLVGTSGWQYRDWRGAFYPPDLRQRDWLEHYASSFAVVEINASFYRLPDRERFAAWAAATPGDFLACPKVSRYLSHMKKLIDPVEPVTRFLQAAGGLGSKLGPVLLQLPPNFPANLARLEAALDAFPPDVRVAVELRHPSWFSEPTRALLADRGAPRGCAVRDARWFAQACTRAGLSPTRVPPASGIRLVPPPGPD